MQWHNCPMRQHPTNPTTNVLAAGISEADLIATIQKSGYPLQSRVVDLLTGHLGRRVRPLAVQEEWSFIDSDEGQTRQVDGMMSFLVDPPPTGGEQGRSYDANTYLRGTITFLIECKRSDLPYVLFARPSLVKQPPLLIGFPHDELEIHVDRPGGTVDGIGISTVDFLECSSLPFSNHDCVASALAKVHRKGSSLELSGEEAYRSLILPLVKAVDYFIRQSTPHRRRLYFDLGILIPVVVVEASLIAAHVAGDDVSLEAVPWIRVARHEPPGGGILESDRVKFVDIVHVDYLRDFSDAALAAAIEMVRRARTAAVQLLTGHARDKDQCETNSPERPAFAQMEPYLTPTQFRQYLDEQWRVCHERINPTEKIAYITGR